MPWKETCTMTERRAFIEAWLSHELTFTRLCRRFGVSTKTGYKWVNRFLERGWDGLQERSRAPHSHPNRTPEPIVAELLEAKHAHPDWGPDTIVALLKRQRPRLPWPAPSTVGELFKRHGLVKPRRKRRRVPPHTQPLQHATPAHHVWSADFKGDFLLGDGQRCFPLTLFDNHSRFLIDCKGLYSTALPPVRNRLELAFQRFGLPHALRTDNGYPFASTAIGGLTALSIWLLRLGVTPERIDPGCPQQNPRHERMHQTLKHAAISPPKANLSAQQRAFNLFIDEYNHLRPHHGLAKRRPDEFFSHTGRAFPDSLPEPHYPCEFLVRRVRHNGEFRSKGRRIYLHEGLARQAIGLRPLGHDLFQLYFCNLSLGVFDERLGTITRPDKRPRR